MEVVIIKDFNMLLINDSISVIGELTVSRSLGDDNKLIIQGVLSMHDYIEEIGSIESDRYLLTGIHVIEEVFGSSDIRIVYKFYAKKLEVKNGQRFIDGAELLKIEKERWEDINGKG